MEKKRLIIRQLSADYPIQTLCTVLRCAPSSYYYQAQEAQAEKEDAALLKSIEALLASKPYLGYRMIQARLKRRGDDAPERAIRRILRQLGRTRSAGRVVTTDSTHGHPRYPNQIKGVKVTAPDDVWVADITYLRYGRQYVYLAVILDLYSRQVRGWQLEEFLTCDALTLPTLRHALKQGTPRIFHSDQGRQYAAASHVTLLNSVNATVSMSDAGCPTQNGVVERFIRTVKEEHVYYSEYESLGDMRRQLKQFLEVEYNQERPHSSLDYMTPSEFEYAYHQQDAQQKAVISPSIPQPTPPLQRPNDDTR